MAVKKRTVSRRRPTLDLMAAMKDYLLNRSMRERSEWHESQIKKQLMGELEIAGVREENKDTLALDEPLTLTTYKDGKPKEKIVVGIERRKRTTTTMNEEKALALVKRKKLEDECTETIQVIVEDAILAANYQGKITDKELAALYEESTTYAFWLTEG